MTQREKILVGCVAGAAVLYGAMSGLDSYRSAVAKNEDTARRAATALSDAEFSVKRGQKAKQRLVAWGERSLPTDPDVAKSLYQDWIRTQLTAAGLQEVSVTDKTFARRNASYLEISLEAKASGTMEQLTDFLYKFYAGPHMQRISGATLTPAENGNKIGVSLTIDALTLPDANRKTELSKAAEQKLPETQDAFRTSIASRNVFKPQTPGGHNDNGDSLAAGARLSAITSDGDHGYHLWVTTENPNKTRKYKVGDKVHYGKFKGTIVELDKAHGRAIFDTENGRVFVMLDHNLSEAKPVDKSDT